MPTATASKFIYLAEARAEVSIMRALAFVLVGGLSALVPVAGQTAKPLAKTKTSSKSWTVPRTPDGQPDLQGVWSNATITPLERPAELGDHG
jgi:hypothetical protein